MPRRHRDCVRRARAHRQNFSSAPGGSRGARELFVIVVLTAPQTSMLETSLPPKNAWSTARTLLRLRKMRSESPVERSQTQ
ncbi:hypothetical protein FIBSPDRAFT_65686 [Athelia psychrophila]|uniref:Uncharacterized protein n=1 Tax=Athelia psychrophila TaxID=1759441 RepID=A0A166EXB1_9AGAM|nr:hypothetical protein FIBSPDRAFT_65686 [Fibularhizoctonia sp. CBS 109695]